MKLKSSCLGCFAAFSCGTRMEIINLLQEKGKISVLEITKSFHVTQPTITHHLKYLKNVHILSSKKEGRHVYYFLHPKCNENICHIFS
ncbi:MAG: Regulatory protein ArsR [Candidatus Daviesbacteria bacterium GW2011_GWA1_41_61]|uniref:Regulatory protein ArsR n=1 Tax=Candidatus Daviesbacteria bacterium GW2011_GWA2_40_9 TaxID=1618424 RepID=A0A0G0U1R3_9BACT|nr:MAG: Regulatory protein ArsR [Candidatus Daviesbacteria bacterium GW2011_GWC1_40_9]KKR83053.1 MAG: Regulatory protein ArsR [Candidatus Daviesbacteria bacterium GW2011_GWA2_40_9]KKR92977.1 MAG: Regulatory protein ArsR [Candidatus Daviesbacteria bacterium GW2011_GWB1_41_15]KKS15521.1 MAG: Regulatory protein ArsR [Candidatus Daviesbacteria bacterium GW2011_GWA1_41_61]